MAMQISGGNLQLNTVTAGSGNITSVKAKQAGGGLLKKAIDSTSAKDGQQESSLEDIGKKGPEDPKGKPTTENDSKTNSDRNKAVVATIKGSDLSKAVWKDNANAQDATGKSTEGKSETKTNGSGNSQIPEFESANKSVKGMDFKDLQNTFSEKGIQERTGFKDSDIPSSSSPGGADSSQAAQGAGPNALAGALGGGLGGPIINSFNTNSGNNGSFNNNSNVDSGSSSGGRSDLVGPREEVGETLKAPEPPIDPGMDRSADNRK